MKNPQKKPEIPTWLTAVSFMATGLLVLTIAWWAAKSTGMKMTSGGDWGSAKLIVKQRK